MSNLYGERDFMTNMQDDLLCMQAKPTTVIIDNVKCNTTTPLVNGAAVSKQKENLHAEN